MNHIITITGDMNDADDCSSSNSVDLQQLVFKGWEEKLATSEITFQQFFKAFGESLKEFDKKNPHNSNWSNRTYSGDNNISSRKKVLNILVHKLKIEALCDPEDLLDILWDYLPGSCDYPVHTIYEITALPEEGQITFY